MKEWLKQYAFKIIIAVIGVVGVWQVDIKVDINELIKSNNETEVKNNEINKQYYDDLIEEINDLKLQIKDCNDDRYNSNNNLREELNTIKNSMLLLEFSNSDDVEWVTDNKGIIIAITKGYIEKVLNPLSINPTEFIGTNGSAAIPKEMLDEWVNNTLKVIKKEEVEVSVEYIPKGTKGISIKRPIASRYGGVLGTRGIWYPMDLFKDLF